MQQMLLLWVPKILGHMGSLSHFALCPNHQLTFSQLPKFGIFPAGCSQFVLIQISILQGEVL